MLPTAISCLRRGIPLLDPFYITPVMRLHPLFIATLLPAVTLAQKTSCQTPCGRHRDSNIELNAANIQ
jgi:hypothetical protein